MGGSVEVKGGSEGGSVEGSEGGSVQGSEGGSVQGNEGGSVEVRGVRVEVWR